MKALRTKIGTYAVVLLMSCGFATTSMAGSSDFSGIYGAFTGSAGGAQIDGRHVNQSAEVNNGQVGGVFPMAGYEIGFNLPLRSVFFPLIILDGNATYISFGAGQLIVWTNPSNVCEYYEFFFVIRKL